VPLQLWIHDGDRMVLTHVSVAPGLYKIFDEILVNAADNKARDPKMDTLRVDIDPVRPKISPILHPNIVSASDSQTSFA